MSCGRDYRLLALVAVLAVLAGCATNRIKGCEGHLVSINPPPPRPAVAAPAPVQKSQPARTSEHKP